MVNNVEVPEQSERTVAEGSGRSARFGSLPIREDLPEGIPRRRDRPGWQLVAKDAGAAPGSRVMGGNRRPSTAVGPRLVRFLFARRFAERERVALLEEDLTGVAADLEELLGHAYTRLDAHDDGLGCLRLDTSRQVSTVQSDLEQASEVTKILGESAAESEQELASMTDRAHLDRIHKVIGELRRIANDERGHLDSDSTDPIDVAAPVASQTRTVTLDAPLTAESKALIDGVSSVWPHATVEAYVRARQILEVDFSRHPELPALSETVAELLASVCLDGGSPDDLRAYLDDSYWRFLHTLDLVGSEQVRALELGANPYFTTVLLWEYRDLELELANFFGWEDTDVGTQVVAYVDAEGIEKERTVEFRHFNIELDRFPYKDESFELVLFCEILEHLVEDPVAVLAEINRVTEVGGHLVLTTPNVARAENVARIINGDNLYDPYSGFGPYGRHNREYTLDELGQILRFSGFTVEHAYSADGHPWSPDVDRLEAVRSELDARMGDLGHYLFVRAVKTGPPHDGRPAFLYRSMSDVELVPTEITSRGE